MSVVITLAALLAGWAATTRLHPDPNSIPSFTARQPEAKWQAPVAQARTQIRTTITRGNLPGVSVAVGAEGAVVWAEGFGYADIRSTTTVTPNHRFPFGSASVAVTRSAILALMAQGLMEPDDEIQKYVPGYPVKQWPVTLRHLMEDTAGLPSDAGGQPPLYTRHCDQTTDALPYFAKRELLTEPGKAFRRTDYGWILLSAAIETAARKPLREVLRESIFSPLSMRDTDAAHAGTIDDDFPLANLVRETVFDPRASRIAALGPLTAPPGGGVTLYSPRFFRSPRYGLHVARPADVSCYAGAGAIVTTPSDLVRFGLAHVPGAVTGQFPGGGAATLLAKRDTGLAVAVMSNISHADTASLAERIAEAFGARVEDSR